MASVRIAVVTGGNKGIGLAIVKSLCEKFGDGIVYLTARDESRGKAAVNELEKQGLKPKFHLLDIDSVASIQSFAKFLKSEHGGLDVLVNNASIAYKTDTTAPAAEQAENSIKTNYFGTKNVCKELFPLLRPHARVVNLSSMVGLLKHLPSSTLRAKFSSDTLTEDELDQLMKQFVDDTKAGLQKQNEWCPSNYAMSKIGITALTFCQQRAFNGDSRKDIVANAVHPGYIATDMSSFKGPGTVEEGADAPVYLALLPEYVKEPKGDFVWNDRSIRSWLN